ncbi:MAG: hypothetical protein ACPHEP_03520, partial [Acidimicrobiales bacterium]
TEMQVAKANDMKLYLSQLLGAYDTAISIYEGGPALSTGEGAIDPLDPRFFGSGGNNNTSE